MDKVIENTAPAMVNVFVFRDDLNPKNIKCYGWINEKYYEYPRGEVSKMPAYIASEIVSTRNGQEVK